MLGMKLTFDEGLNIFIDLFTVEELERAQKILSLHKYYFKK